MTVNYKVCLECANVSHYFDLTNKVSGKLETLILCV